MTSIFEKLNLKQQEILVVNAPSSFEPALLELESIAVHRDPKMLKAIHFALVFATRQAEVDALSNVCQSVSGLRICIFTLPFDLSKKA